MSRGTALVDGHTFDVIHIGMDKGNIVFTLCKTCCTISIGPRCDITIMDGDDKVVGELTKHPISDMPITTVAGDLTIFLPIHWSAMHASKGTDAPYVPGKVYPFTDAIVGNKAYTYQQADGGMVCGEYGWVTDLDYFDERDGEIILVRKKWVLLEVDEVVLEDPYPPLLEELDLVE